MKKIILSTFVVSAMLLTACGGKEEAGDETKKDNGKQEEVQKEENVEKLMLSVNTEESVVKWHGYNTEDTEHMHKGTLKLSEGNVVVEGDQVTGGSITIDMSTIKEGEETGNDYSAKLEGHLMAEDFFNVSQFATATFTINSVDGNHANGTLNIVGVEIPVEADLNVENSEEKVTITSDLTVDLTPMNAPGFEVPEDAPEEAHSPNVNISVTIVANK